MQANGTCLHILTQAVIGVPKMATVLLCYGWQVRNLPYMKVLIVMSITCGHTGHGTL